MFEKLLDKFDNFNVIIEAWYKDKQYYPFLKEIWTRYICIENLRGKDEKEIEKLLISNKINYNNWPENIKDEFNILINNTDKTRIMELKNIIDNQFSEFNCLIEGLLKFKKNVKDIPDIKQYEINAKNMIFAIIGTVFLPIAYCASKGFDAVDNKQIKSVEKLICKNTFFEDKKIKSLTKNLMNIIEGDEGTHIYELKPDPDLIEEVRVKCTDGKIDNLPLCKTAKTFLKNKWVYGLHAILSFLNLGYAVIEFTKTYNGFDEIKNYKKRYNDIKTNFDLHKKQIGILPDDFKEAIKIIKDIYEKIREDQKELQKLMEDIMKSIKFQESQQTKATVSLIGSLALGTAGVIGGFSTGNFASAIYGASTVMNIISGITNGANIIISKNIVKQLNDILDKAINLNKEIQDKIDELIKEIQKRLEQEPKFDLYESNSSISTYA